LGSHARFPHLSRTLGHARLITVSRSHSADAGEAMRRSAKCRFYWCTLSARRTQNNANIKHRRLHFPDNLPREKQKRVAAVSNTQKIAGGAWNEYFVHVKRNIFALKKKYELTLPRKPLNAENSRCAANRKNWRNTGISYSISTKDVKSNEWRAVCIPPHHDVTECQDPPPTPPYKCDFMHEPHVSLS